MELLSLGLAFKAPEDLKEGWALQKGKYSFLFLLYPSAKAL